uniref:Palmitoyltransferase n=1 Tax=Magallana gigas TaxID=29159 RepID=K1QA77_MAGGI
MAVSRAVTINLEEPDDESKLTLMEKWRKHVEKKRKEGHDAKVGICVVTKFCANYLCVRLYDTMYRTTRDNPQPKEIHERWRNPPEKFVPLHPNRNGTPNGHVEDNHGGLPWTYCDVCELKIPPRTHHCYFCKACILKRDHHCFMVGTCIGHKNQRYFVVMAFWTMVCGLFGGVFTFVYIKHLHWPFAPWTDFFLPLTIYRTLWHGSIPLHIGLMIYHLHMEFLFGALGTFYFISQMLIISQGKTLYELTKEVPVKSSNSVNSNYVSVFVSNMAVARSVKVEIPTNEAEEDEPSTLMGKWRKHYEEKKREGHQSRRMLYLCWALWVFQTPTQPYMAFAHIIPYIMYEFTDWTQYYVKVIYIFCVIQTLGNLVCVTLYSTRYVKTRDRPEAQEVRERWENAPDQFGLPMAEVLNGHLPDNGGIPWSYCDKCDMMKPPRAHHCKVCKACILKRDHHCFVIGTCVGHYNQRYFVVLTFYATIVGFGGVVLTACYLSMLYWPEAVWTDFLLPVAIYRGLFGAMKGYIAIMIVHLYTASFIGLFGLLYFTSQLIIVTKGVTLYELAKNVPIRNNKSTNANFVEVFGNFWFLNFIFPMTIMFPLENDGTTWKGIKLDHNSNYQGSDVE